MTNDLIMIATISKVLPELKINSADDLINVSRNGIQAKYLGIVMEYTGLSNKELADVLPISERQLIRYAADKIMKQEVTERLLHIIDLYSFGYDFFKVRSEFQRWMRSENIALGGSTPLSLIDTSYGINMVRTVIGRAMHGIFS